MVGIYVSPPTVVVCFSSIFLTNLNFKMMNYILHVVQLFITIKWIRGTQLVLYVFNKCATSKDLGTKVCCTKLTNNYSIEVEKNSTYKESNM